MKDIISSFPNESIKTITVDNGKDFSCYKSIEE